jgi:hypothetical protein
MTKHDVPNECRDRIVTGYKSDSGTAIRGNPDVLTSQIDAALDRMPRYSNEASTSAPVGVTTRAIGSPAKLP